MFNLLLCSLLGLCHQDSMVDTSTMNTIDEIAICNNINNYSTANELCDSLVYNVMNRLPLEVQNRIVDTTEYIEIIPSNAKQFMAYVIPQLEEKDVPKYKFTGLARYGYSDKTLVNSIADENVILHELGHAYDFSFSYDSKTIPSNTSQWMDSYETEYVSELGTFNRQEFYAETFLAYWTDPLMLKETCPKAYALHEQEFGKYIK